MPDHFIPDEYHDTYREITPEHLVQLGIRGLICDIDNTLVTYDDPEPTPAVRNWMEELALRGIAVAFVSNNDRERVERFCAGTDCFYAWKSGKPGDRELRRAMAYMHTDQKTTALLGDQIFTDIYAGKRLGLRCFLVKPIRDKRSLFFRMKRFFEIPVLRRYARLHGEAYRPNIVRCSSAQE